MTRHLLHAIRLPVCLALALSASLSAAQTPSAPAGAGAAASASDTVPGVGVARLDSVWLQPEREAPASVQARNVSRLSAEVAGTLQQWTVDVGAPVRRGQLLAQIDRRDHELALQRAQAALDAAQSRLRLAQGQLQRSRELVEQGFYSREALAQRETEVALMNSEVSAARAQQATAQRQLERTALRAPFDATVLERLAQTGEAVAPGTVLYVLSETGAPEISSALSPGDVPGLRAARQLRFEAQGQRHPVRLLRVAPTLTAPARTQTARLAFTQPATAPASGTSGTLRWQETRAHVPPALMVRRGNTLGVFVSEGSGASATARFVPLPEAQEGRAAPVALPADTALIVRGQQMLQPGQRIQVQTASGAAN